MDNPNKDKVFSLPTAKKGKGLPVKTPHERMGEHAASADAIFANHQRILDETKEILGQDASKSTSQGVGISQAIAPALEPGGTAGNNPPKTLLEKIEAHGDQAEAIVANHKEYQDEARDQFSREGARAAQRVAHEQTLSETAIKTSIEVTSVVNRQIAAINLKVSGYRFKANYRILIEWAAEKMMTMDEEVIYRELLPYYRRGKK